MNCPARWKIVGIATLVVVAGSCREPIRALGIVPAGASERGAGTGARALFSTLQARVSEPRRDAKYDSARVRIASAAVVPSRIWRDTSIWTAVADSQRQLLVHGRFRGGHYWLEAARVVPFPREPAEARHLITLRRLSDDEFAWDTDVPFVLGDVRAAAVGGMFAAIMASAEGRTEREIRADYRAMLPRTTAVMGAMFQVDSVRSVALADGSTTALFAVALTPDGVARRYPALAKYLQRYVNNARVRLTLLNAAGAPYLELSIADSQLFMRVRTLDGRMIALYGPPRPMPDSLVLSADVTVKVRGFTVGMRNYRGDFQMVSQPGERSWVLVSTTEPEWVLPLITARLLRTPLRRPFQGEGARFQIGVRDSAGAPSVLRRSLHLEVQESAILRFIARLGAIAVSDYAGDVEREEMAWLREVFSAMLTDIQGS